MRSTFPNVAPNQEYEPSEILCIVWTNVLAKKNNQLSGVHFPFLSNWNNFGNTQVCKWRFGAVLAVSAATDGMKSCFGSGMVENPLLLEIMAKVRASIAAGPYGGHTTQEAIHSEAVPLVATAYRWLARITICENDQTRLVPDHRARNFCCRAGRTDRIGAGVRLVRQTIGDKGRDTTLQETLKLANSFMTWY